MTSHSARRFITPGVLCEVEQPSAPGHSYALRLRSLYCFGFCWTKIPQSPSRHFFHSSNERGQNCSSRLLILKSQSKEGTGTGSQVTGLWRPRGRTKDSGHRLLELLGLNAWPSQGGAAAAHGRATLLGCGELWPPAAPAPLPGRHHTWSAAPPPEDVAGSPPPRAAPTERRPFQPPWSPCSVPGGPARLGWARLGSSPRRQSAAVAGTARRAPALM